MNVWNEKWNYEACFLGEVSEETRESFKSPRVYRISNLNPLSWNAFEEEIIGRLIESFYYFLDSNDIKKIEIHDEQIVILNEDKRRPKAQCLAGYVYVSRSSNKASFISSLARKISHLLSFYSLEIEERDRQRFVNVRQSGYRLKASDGSYLYSGLNEAVTDLCSKLALGHLLSTKLNVLKGSEKKDILNRFSYPHHVSLLEDIVFLKKNNPLRSSLLRSYFDGSDSFFKILEKENSLSYKIFKNVDKSKRPNNT